jgi:CzcA family heavy metal efflux pump
MMGQAFNRFLNQQSRAVYLATLLLVIAGILALFALASGIYPEVTFPRVIVLVEAGDVAAQNLLPGVTRPIEEAVSKIPGFTQVRTQTLRGMVETSVEFSNQTDIELALQQVRGRVGELRPSFPANANVTIERLMPSVFPVLSYNLSATNLSIPVLTEQAMYQIRPRLLQIPGVAQVKVQSAQSREISVEVDPERLASLQLSLSQVALAVQQTNQVTVIGRSERAHQQALILGTGELFQPDDFNKIVVATRGGTPITLGEIATIQDGSNDIVTAFSGNGRPAVLISIIKQPNGNLIEITDAVNRVLPDIMRQLPKGTEIQPVYNLANLVSASIDNLRDSILIGIALIILIIYLFLRDWRSTWIASATIPVTMAITFGLMYLGHQTLNLMSLGGLAVAVGLVIDDAIVMIEGVFHNLQSGLLPREAANKAVSELAEPVISSTITTIVVFAPLGLLEGVVGQFFSALSYTLTASVLISLALALTVIPILCQQFLKIPQKKSGMDQPKRGLFPQFPRFDFIQLVRKILPQSLWVLALSAIMIVLLLPLSGFLEKGFMPEIDEGSFVLDYYAPPGTSLSDTDHIARRIEQVLSQTPEVMNYSRRTGARLGLAASETSQGDILVRLQDLGQRHRSTPQVMQEVRQALASKLPGVDIELTQILQDLINDLADSPAPIAIKIFGPDPVVLKRLGDQVGDILQGISGVVDINRHTRPSATEETVRVNPVAANKFGLQVFDVLTQTQMALLGTTVTSVREQDKLIPVRIRYLDAKRKGYSEDLATTPIFNPNGAMAPLGSLAQIESRPGQLEIRRENLARLGLITGRLDNRDLGSVMKEVQAKISKLDFPTGYYVAYGGQWASQQKAFTNLSLVLGLAILLVYLVLVVQFRSLLTPLPILIAVPLSLVGVFLGLILLRVPLNISSFMGIILLVGLVVKNGIILLTYAQERLAEGHPLEVALQEAVELRLRPILMTTICTLLGLLPLALGLGAGAELQKPLAISVISGLTVSTFITLLVTPTLFLWLQRVKLFR